MKPIIWLIILVLFGIGEAVTVGLTSIWFALGALGALIVSPVSYTHLDVYKRQPLWAGIDSAAIRRSVVSLHRTVD